MITSRKFMQNVPIFFFIFFLHNFAIGQEVPYKDPLILYNQVGYITIAPKVLLTSDRVELVEMYDQHNIKVFSEKPEPPLYWNLSGESVRKLDFTKIQIPGIYKLVIPGTGQIFEININEKPFYELAKAVQKAYYYNRSGFEITPEFGGIWSRPAGHPDTLVFIHDSASDSNRPTNSTIPSSFGWYDAGDYNKYIVNSGITMFTLLTALNDYPEYFNELEVHIPGNEEGFPDLLTEILFNLNWMISMQDPIDGGVYHKLTNKNFDGSILPHHAKEKRYVVAKTTAATLNFAAVMANAYRVLKKYEGFLPGLADDCLEKAKKAWNWAEKHPALVYKQPSDIYTGQYGDESLNDEFFWAATELFLATIEEKYIDKITSNFAMPDVPGWQNVRTLGYISLLSNQKIVAGQLKMPYLSQSFLNLADSLVKVSQDSPYGISLGKFDWGSNSTVANEGMIKMIAYKHTKKPGYLISAISDLDYILGKNATAYCFVTGFGTKKVMNIHHRPSESDGIREPVPGFLAGGPNTVVMTDCSPKIARSKWPAKSYVDQACSYSTNEVAINWNAPLIYLLAGIQNFY